MTRPCEGVHKRTSLMSSSLLFQQCPACLVRLTWMVFEMGCKWPYSWVFFLWNFISRICSKYLVAFLCGFHLAFSLCVSLACLWCIHTVVLTQPQLGRTPILFYRIDKISIWSITFRYQSTPLMGWNSYKINRWTRSIKVKLRREIVIVSYFAKGLFRENISRMRN